MRCLAYLETAISTPLSRLLRTNGFDVHLTTDIDDLLDQLWFYGSEVACIVMEGRNVPEMSDFIEAITDWPDITVLAYGDILKLVDPSLSNIRHNDHYRIDRVALDIRSLTKRSADTHC